MKGHDVCHHPIVDINLHQQPRRGPEINANLWPLTRRRYFGCVG